LAKYYLPIPTIYKLMAIFVTRTVHKHTVNLYTTTSFTQRRKSQRRPLHATVVTSTPIIHVPHMCISCDQTERLTMHTAIQWY
jgi:hypothetical protein